MGRVGAIILAAGKGSRMKATTVNKVAMPLLDKPMIIHTIERLEKMNIKDIVVVVGFAKESVMNALGNKVIFAVQNKRLGTAHAVTCGLKEIPEGIEHVLVVNGDDSAFYTTEILENLIKTHSESKAALTFLTIERDNPTGLGRIVRGTNGRLSSIVEEKDATDKEREIKEINPGCYLFSVQFLKKYLPMVQKSPVSGEYYITSLIDIGIKHGEVVETQKAGNIVWRGVNTKEELLEAEKIMQQAV